MTLLPPLENPPLRAGIITLSDKASRGQRQDESGPLIAQMLTEAGYQVEESLVLPDEEKALKTQLMRLADGRQLNLILTTGGTGFSPGISPRRPPALWPTAMPPASQRPCASTA